MQIKEINTADKNYGFIEALLIEAFPEDERRDTSEQRRYADDNPSFHSCLIIDDDGNAGLLNYWDFDSFCYIEHFANSHEKRNKGIGARALRAFIDQIGKPVVLEVERPDCELSRRRIAFYQRQGLKLWDVDYIQPAYRKGGAEVPMLLMASPSLSQEVDSEDIIKTIHNQVYNA